LGSDYRPTPNEVPCTRRKEYDMKRTRRIRVISYSHRVTVIEGSDSVVGSALVDDLPIIDDISLAHENVDTRMTAIDVTNKTSPLRLGRRLRNLLRLRR